MWTYDHFAGLPKFAVAAALSRLARKRIIHRVRKGVYYAPRKTRFGETVADPAAVTAAILKRRGIAWRVSGLPAYNGLGLTTQVSPTRVYAVHRAQDGVEYQLVSAGSARDHTPDLNAVSAHECRCRLALARALPLGLEESHQIGVVGARGG